MTQTGIVNKSKKAGSLKKGIAGILILLILLTILFLYLYLTKNSILWNFPIFPKSVLKPDFLYHFEALDLNSPRGVATDPFDKVYIADNLNGRIRVFTKDGRAVDEFGHQELLAPYGLVAHNGFIFVTDHIAGKVQSFNFNGTFRKTIVERGQEGVGMFSPTAITVDVDNDNLYVADIAEHRIVVFSREGELLFTFGGPGEAVGSFSYPGGIALDKNKNIYVADSNNGRIQVFNPDGSKVLYVVYGGEADEQKFSLPASIAVDKNSFLWVVDTFTHTVSVFDKQHQVISFGGLGVEEGELYFPYGIVLDSKGNVYVTERALNRVSVFGSPAATAANSGR